MATLYVLEQGAEIRCDGERLAIWQTDQELGNVPMAKLEDIVVMGNIGFSTPAIKRLLDQQIEVTFLTIHGRYHGRLIGEATAHVALRRNQYRRADDEAWALAMAQACVSGKLRNCRAVLQRFARNRQQVEKEVLESIEALDHFIDRVDRTTKISSLVGVEGSGSAAYFGGLRSLFDSEWMFNNRNRRPPTDPVNVLLSLGYTLLVHKTLGAVQAVGFDPYQGFLHQLDYNRPSLVLDLIEEFRPILVDALVIRCCNDGRLTANDFSQSDDPKHPILLSNEGKKRFVAAFEERMRTEVTHPDGAWTAWQSQLLALYRASGPLIGACNPDWHRLSSLDNPLGARMLYLISYDIAVDKRRTKIAKILEGFGQRVQYSVFECDLTAKQYTKLRGKLHKVLRPEDGDNLRTYRICAACAPNTEIVGNGPALETSVTIYIF